jgi:hypothetical protein
MRVMNVAGIHGALGDHGQSYKSIDYLANAVFDAKSSAKQIVHGCGK